MCGTTLKISITRHNRSIIDYSKGESESKGIYWIYKFNLTATLIYVLTSFYFILFYTNLCYSILFNFFIFFSIFSIKVSCIIFFFYSIRFFYSKILSPVSERTPWFTGSLEQSRIYKDKTRFITFPLSCLYPLFFMPCSPSFSPYIAPPPPAVQSMLFFIQ